jgi:hypothetical protein
MGCVSQMQFVQKTHQKIIFYNALIFRYLGVTPKGAAPFRASLRSVLRTLRPSRQLTQPHPLYVIPPQLMLRFTYYKGSKKITKLHTKIEATCIY